MFFKSYISHLIVILFIFISISSFSQEYSKKNIIDIANSIINDSHSCVFITLDSNNKPTSRLMDPNIYNNDFEIYLVTNPNSRKVSHIRNDNRITLNFSHKKRGSYVSINGTAKLINELSKKKKYWKSEWTPYYKDLDKDCILIKINPKSLEIVSTPSNIFSDPVTWEPTTIIF
ncbi:pyridoxamine 5'-phosphate oxidase family protein [Flavobacteriaceae bacterium]|nr:pyridoxamine 5'-phosphate oxidase family protein [Flavobacteriaceae bacterium]